MTAARAPSEEVTFRFCTTPHLCPGHNGGQHSVVFDPRDQAAEAATIPLDSIRLMNVILVEPFFPSNQREFARVLAEAGAAVIGVGETPHYGLEDQLKDWLTHYQQVSSVTDAEAMTGVVRSIQDRVWVDRPEATVEAHTMAGGQSPRGMRDPRYVGAYGVAVPRQALDEAGAAGGRRTQRDLDGRRFRGRGARLRRGGRFPPHSQAAQWSGRR